VDTGRARRGTGVNAGRGRPDLATAAFDDALLDVLGRGAPVSGADEVAALLAAWRAELAALPVGGRPGGSVPDPPGPP
jgi:Anti-sigma-D factor RsdA to sigma factor binding region